MMNKKTFSYLFILIFLLTSCKRSNEQLINEGIKLQEKEKYKEAIDMFTKALNKNSKLQLAYYKRGICYAELKDFKKALQDINILIQLKMPAGGNFIIELNSNSPIADEEARANVPYNDALYERARVLWALDSLKPAYDDFKKLVSNNYKEKVFCILWQADIWHEAGNDSIACSFANQAKILAIRDDEFKEAEKTLVKYCK
jgi:tetratricopeptide (TPR) repeat protein